MNYQLTETTKQKIKRVFNHLVSDLLEDESMSFCRKPFEDFPPYLLKRVNDVVVEKFNQNFDTIENGYELLQDYYDENGNLKDYEELKKLSCEFAESLI